MLLMSLMRLPNYAKVHVSIQESAITTTAQRLRGKGYQRAEWHEAEGMMGCNSERYAQQVVPSIGKTVFTQVYDWGV